MKMIKVELLVDNLTLDGVDRNIDDVVDIPESLFSLWKEKGYCRLTVDVPTDLEKSEEAEEMEESEETKEPEEPELNHIGGGYYLLPNGDKVHGKQAAIDALTALKGGEGNES